MQTNTQRETNTHTENQIHTPTEHIRTRLKKIHTQGHRHTHNDPNTHTNKPSEQTHKQKHPKRPDDEDLAN